MTTIDPTTTLAELVIARPELDATPMPVASTEPEWDGIDGLVDHLEAEQVLTGGAT